MKNLKPILIISFSIMLLTGFAQTPATDPHWVLQWNDEFDYTGTHAQKIAALQNKWLIGCGNKDEDNALRGGCNYYKTEDGSDLNLANGICTLLVQHNPANYTLPCVCPTQQVGRSTHAYDYTVGEITSKYEMKYGYIEAGIRLPALNPNQPLSGMQPNFWMWNLGAGGTYSELDIFENVAIKDGVWRFSPTVRYQNMNTTDQGLYRIYDESPSTNKTFPKNYNYYDLSFNDDAFHKIGVEWSPDFINYYVDDMLQSSVSWEGKVKLLRPMNAIFDVYAYNAFNYQKNDKNTLPPFACPDNFTSPFRFEIEYFRFYTLNYPASLQTISSSSMYNYTTFNQAEVKRSISLGSSNLAGGLTPAVTLNMRATDFVELTEGFITDNNTNLNITVNEKY